MKEKRIQHVVDVLKFRKIMDEAALLRVARDRNGMRGDAFALKTALAPLIKSGAVIATGNDYTGRVFEYVGE